MVAEWLGRNAGRCGFPCSNLTVMFWAHLQCYKIDLFWFDFYKTIFPEKKVKFQNAHANSTAMSKTGLPASKRFSLTSRLQRSRYRLLTWLLCMWIYLNSIQFLMIGDQNWSSHWFSNKQHYLSLNSIQFLMDFLPQWQVDVHHKTCFAGVMTGPQPESSFSFHDTFFDFFSQLIRLRFLV